MSEKYYRLNPECYLVKGAKGGLIMNLYENKAIAIDEDLSDMLLKLEQGSRLEESHENLEKLMEMGWANEYAAPAFIDKIRVTNVFGKRHMWKSAPVINLAVLQITGECDRGCADCLSERCPSCKKKDDVKSMSLEDWKRTVDRLEEHKANTLLLTGGDPTLNKDYEKILEYIGSKKINAFIHVPSIASYKKIKDKYNVFLTITDEADLENVGTLLRTSKNIARVFVNEKDVLKVRVKDPRIQFINRSSLKIKKSNMFAQGIDPYRFSLKQMYNECFYGKLCIDPAGEIMPCLGANLSLGNILAEDYTEGFKKLIEDYWFVSVDDAEKGYKCKRCENRYACRNVCIFSEDREQCSYDVEGAKWSCQ